MTKALLAPDARQRIISALGAVVPGAKLWTYVADSNTPLETYSNADLASGHENANPVVADSAGLFGPIYFLFGRDYDLVLTDANDVQIWAQPDVTVGGVAQQTFDVTAYGAIPGVVVDSKLAIQAAVDAAAAVASATAPCTVYFPTMFRSSGAIICNASYITFAGNGPYSGIQFDDAALSSSLRISAPPSDVVVTSVLASNVAIGDRTVTVGAGEGPNFAAGGWLFCSDGVTDHGTFITFIESIAGDVLTLQDASPVTLTTAGGATAKYRPSGVLQGIVVRDLRLACASAIPASLSSLLSVQTSQAPIVRNVQTSGCKVAGLWFQQVVDGVMQNCLAENAVSNNGEGFLIAQSTNCKIEGSTAAHTQFGFVVTQSPKVSIVGCQVHRRNTNFAGGRGIKCSEGSNFASLVGNNLADCNFFGIYFQDAAWCQAVGNTILGMGGGAAGDGEHGIQCGGNQDELSHHCTLVGNNIVSCSGFGISLTPTLLTVAKDTYHTVSSNTIADCKQGGILNFACNRNTIIGNKITSDPATLTQGGAIAAISSSASLFIANNSIYSSSGAAMVGIITTGGDGSSTVLNNQLGPAVSQALALGDGAYGATREICATVFETAARFGTTNNGAGANTFNNNGAVLNTSATINSSAGVKLLIATAADNLYLGSPRFTARFGFTLKGTDGQALISIFETTVTGTTLTFTDPHVGFKLVWAASGVATLSATNASGGVEVATALTTVAQGDEIEVIAQVNGSASIDYYWRKNGGVLSPAVIHTTRLPTGGSNFSIGAAICNSNVASDSTITMRAMSYAR